MVKAELSYNPYLLETLVKFNGEKPMINSLVEKYENNKLQYWIFKLPKIFYDEMNGYDFDLDFSGTLLDYNAVVDAFKDAKVSSDDVRIFHKNELEDPRIKEDRIDSLLEWLNKNPNMKFDYEKFREENTEIFDTDYSFIFIQDNKVDSTISFKDKVSFEKIDELNQLPSDLSLSPILFYIAENDHVKIRRFIKEILSHEEVIQEQLFFLVNPDLNFLTVERTIKDLGVEFPQLINSDTDEKLENYFAVFPITDYVIQAIEVFKIEANKIRKILEIENEDSKAANAVIYQKIDLSEQKITRLKETQDKFSQRDNLEIPENFLKSKYDLLGKIQSWRKKKVKIDNDEDADKVISEFDNEVRNFFAEFIEEVETTFNYEIYEIDNSYATIYHDVGIADPFSPKINTPVQLNKFTIPSLISDLKKFRKEEAVQKQEDFLNIFNPFTKKDPNAPIQMVQQITYLYQQFRDKASEIVFPIADDVIELLSGNLEEYYKTSAEKYIDHLEKLINKNISAKEQVANQLSEDEQKLQNDNDWLREFSGQIKDIERG